MREPGPGEPLASNGDALSRMAEAAAQRPCSMSTWVDLRPSAGEILLKHLVWE